MLKDSQCVLQDQKKISKMKKAEITKSVILKWSLVIAALLFADWLIMVILGCFSGLCRANEKYFCTVYCKIGIVLLSLTLLLFGYFIYKSYRKK